MFAFKTITIATIVWGLLVVQVAMEVQAALVV
jgi:hypothetical protein